MLEHAGKETLHPRPETHNKDVDNRSDCVSTMDSAEDSEDAADEDELSDHEYATSGHSTITEACLHLGTAHQLLTFMWNRSLTLTRRMALMALSGL